MSCKSQTVEKLRKNIPESLRVLPQWLNWKAVPNGARTKKVPVFNGYPFDPTDITKLLPFEHAIGSYLNTDVSGVGFSLQPTNDLSIIDLDETQDHQATIQQKAIYENLQTYCEFSQSKKGLHIIAKGAIPANIPSKPIEIYSTGQYMVMTGDVLKPLEVCDCRDKLQQLYNYYAPNVKKVTLVKDWENVRSKYNFEKFTDDQIIKIICENKRSCDLLNNFDINKGNEYDLMVVNHLINLGCGFDQTYRIFRMTKAGQREKANRLDYVNKTIAKGFDRHTLSDGLNIQLELQKPKQVTEIPRGKLCSLPTYRSAPNTIAYNSGPAIDIWKMVKSRVLIAHGELFPKVNELYNKGNFVFPDGLLGDIAKYIFTSAKCPVPEIAMISAIGFMAGLCGRCYNVSSTGLNLYLVLLAETGRGKNDIHDGISKIISAVSKKVSSIENVLGPTNFSSQQGILKELHKNRSTVSLLGEVYEDFLKYSNLNNPYGQSVKKLLLQLYAISGRNGILARSSYADTAKCFGVIRRPALSFLGESNPDAFYNSADENLIQAGLLPRVLILEYTGDKVETNPYSDQVVMEELLLSRIALLAKNCELLNNGDSLVDVKESKETLKIISDFEIALNADINENRNDGIGAECMNRVSLIARKIAALLAIGKNFNAPEILENDITWCLDLVNTAQRKIMKRAKKGLLGTGNLEAKQVSLLKSTTLRFFKKATHDPQYENFKSKGVIPYRFLHSVALVEGPFKKAKQGATSSLKKQLESIEGMGAIEKVSRDQMMNLFGRYEIAYHIKNPSWFLD